MDTRQVLKVGFLVNRGVISHFNSSAQISAYLSEIKYIDVRIATIFADYLVKHSKKFNSAYFIFDSSADVLLRYMNKTEVDVIPQVFTVRDEFSGTLDYSYPFQLDHATFMTQKPEYKPQIFGIFQTFSLSIWIAIISILIAMMLICSATLKWKYSLDKIILHNFAILLRQSSVFKPSSVTENMLIYSWVIGAMFICLAYDSVFLSFLTFPPVVKINDVSQLAEAVAKGEYHCIANTYTLFDDDLIKSKEKKFRIIAADLKKNKGINMYENFFYSKRRKNFAFIGYVQLYLEHGTEKIVVSEDTFLEKASAMVSRKNFSCKKMVDRFVHRFMASGLLWKFYSDRSFYSRLRRGFLHEESDTKRKLNLTDVAPAFIFLLTGYFISFLVFIGEVVFSRWKKSSFNIHKKRKNKTANDQTSV